MNHATKWKLKISYTKSDLMVMSVGKLKLTKKQFFALTENSITPVSELYE